MMKNKTATVCKISAIFIGVLGVLWAVLSLLNGVHFTLLIMPMIGLYTLCLIIYGIGEIIISIDKIRFEGYQEKMERMSGDINSSMR